MSIFRSDPAAPGANIGRARQLGETPFEPLELAIERFNASEAARTVAGLARSLGEPRVSVGTKAGAANVVRVTVAWELCWYQWGVDLADESRPVAALGKGGELEELDRSARQWNARRGARGEVALGVPVG